MTVLDGVIDRFLGNAEQVRGGGSCSETTIEPFPVKQAGDVEKAGNRVSQFPERKHEDRLAPAQPVKGHAPGRGSFLLTD